MSYRIDHVVEAKRPLPKRGEGVLPSHLAAAQVHATLALVEQQRIANLLKVEEMMIRSQGYEPRDEIKKGLGL